MLEIRTKRRKKEGKGKKMKVCRSFLSCAACSLLDFYSHRRDWPWYKEGGHTGWCRRVYKTTTSCNGRVGQIYTKLLCSSTRWPGNWNKLLLPWLNRPPSNCGFPDLFTHTNDWLRPEEDSYHEWYMRIDETTTFNTRGVGKIYSLLLRTAPRRSGWWTLHI